MKPKFATIRTPVGTLLYPRLTVPDDKFNKENPVYKTDLVLDKNDPKVQTLLTKLDGLADEAYSKAKAEAKPDVAKKITRVEPYSDEYDSEGNETGNVIVKFKTGSRFKDKQTGKTVEIAPALFDAGNNRINPQKTNIGAGSKAEIAFQANPYYTASSKTAGISCRLQGVRILDLVEYSGRSGAALFGAAVSGYNAKDDDDEDGEAVTTGDDNDGDGDSGATAEEF